MSAKRFANLLSWTKWARARRDASRARETYRDLRGETWTQAMNRITHGGAAQERHGAPAEDAT